MTCQLSLVITLRAYTLFLGPEQPGTTAHHERHAPDSMVPSLCPWCGGGDVCCVGPEHTQKHGTVGAKQLLAFATCQVCIVPTELCGVCLYCLTKLKPSQTQQRKSRFLPGLGCPHPLTCWRGHVLCLLVFCWRCHRRFLLNGTCTRGGVLGRSAPPRGKPHPPASPAHARLSPSNLDGEMLSGRSHLAVGLTCSHNIFERS